MKQILRSTILGLAVAAMTVVSIPAQADHWRRHRDRDNGDALAAGIAGLAVGAIVGGALSQPRYSERVYIDPPRYHYRPAPRYHYRAAPRYQYRPAPVYRGTVHYRGSYEPWSREWYRACNARYRSFDARSGTFMGYDGRRHFCEIR